MAGGERIHSEEWKFILLAASWLCLYRWSHESNFLFVMAFYQIMYWLGDGYLVPSWSEAVFSFLSEKFDVFGPDILAGESHKGFLFFLFSCPILQKNPSIFIGVLVKEQHEKDKCHKILKIFWGYFKINNHLNGQMCLLLGWRHLCICETTMSRSHHLVYYKVIRLVPYSRSTECIESCLPTILIITKIWKRFNAHLAIIKVIFC